MVMLFPRKLIELKLNEVQLKQMGKLEWDFFFGTEEVLSKLSLFQWANMTIVVLLIPSFLDSIDSGVMF
jgi:hypothetical protein